MYGKKLITWFSWILHSITLAIAQSVLWIESVEDVWSDLKDRFGEGDTFRILDILEISTILGNDPTMLVSSIHN